MSTRFQKGQSGNPRGRPKKKRTEVPSSAFDIVIDRTLTVTQDGVSREMTVDEALQHKTYQDAIAGNRAARREVLKWIAEREKEITRRTPRTSNVDIKTEDTDPTNADEALLILGIAGHDPRWEGRNDECEWLLLEPWAVKAALSRRRGRKLNQEDITEAKRCTRDADTLDWPEPEEP